MTLRLILSWFICAQLFACQNTAPKPQTPPAAPAPAEETMYLPSITTEKMEYLWQACNQIDYLFYNLPISTSVDNNASAQVHLRHISDSPVPLMVKQQCNTPIGRIFFKKDGEDLLESEIYFASGCTFFVFFEKGKAKAANYMTAEGVNHFNQLIAAIPKGPGGQ